MPLSRKRCVKINNFYTSIARRRERAIARRRERVKKIALRQLTYTVRVFCCEKTVTVRVSTTDVARTNAQRSRKEKQRRLLFDYRSANVPAYESKLLKVSDFGRNCFFKDGKWYQFRNPDMKCPRCPRMSKASVQHSQKVFKGLIRQNVGPNRCTNYDTCETVGMKDGVKFSHDGVSVVTQATIPSPTVFVS